MAPAHSALRDARAARADSGSAVQLSRADRCCCCWAPLSVIVAAILFVCWLLHLRTLSVASPSGALVAQAYFYQGQWYSDRVRVVEAQSGLSHTGYDRLGLEPWVDEPMVRSRDIIWDPAEAGFLYVYYYDYCPDLWRIQSLASPVGPDTNRHLRAFEFARTARSVTEVPVTGTPWAERLARRHPPPRGMDDWWTER